MAFDVDDAKRQLREALQRLKEAQATRDPMTFAVTARNARLLTNELMPKIEREIVEHRAKWDKEIMEILREFNRLVNEDANWGKGEREH